jgi:4'-phosphopantetheinyl transferase
MQPGPSCYFCEAAVLPGDSAWLGPDERSRLAGLNHRKRRADWLLGRWAVKQAAMMAPELGLTIGDPSRLEILPDGEGVPRAFLDGMPLPLGLSISHRQGAALAAIAATGHVGCDLEWIEERTAAFIEDYFSPREKQSILAATDPAGRALLANGLWSAKESVAKLLGVGLRLDMREVQIETFPIGDVAHWLPVRARLTRDGGRYSGWWCRRQNWILTVFSQPEASPPREIWGERGRGMVPAS